MSKTIVKAIETTYDGFFIVKYDNGKYYSYEGLGLAPNIVRNYIKEHGAEKVNCFHWEAISYGKI